MIMMTVDSAAASAENIFGINQNQNILNDLPVIFSQVVLERRFWVSTHFHSNILGRTGYHVLK